MHVFWVRLVRDPVQTCLLTLLRVRLSCVRQSYFSGSSGADARNGHAWHARHACQTVNVRTPSVGVGRVQSGVHASSSDTSPGVPARATAGLLGWVINLKKTLLLLHQTPLLPHIPTVKGAEDEAHPCTLHLNDVIHGA